MKQVKIALTAVLNLFGRYILPVACLLFSTQNAHAVFCGTGGAVPAGPDASQTPGPPFVTTITVPPSASDVITDLNFDLAITHTWVGDLTVTLTSPAGTTITLLDRPGRPASTWGCSQNNVNVTFDDEAASPAENACAGGGTAIGGSLQPFQPLSTFDGEIMTGDWTLSVTDVYFQDLGTVTSLCTAETTTNPIALNSFQSRKIGSRIIADWQTASENQNLGFNVMARINGEWENTNKRLIKSRIGETLKPQDYQYKIRVNKLPGEVEALALSAISTTGKEEFYGPFLVGEEYGEYEVPDYIDWEKEQKEYATRMTSSGYALHRNVWIPVATEERNDSDGETTPEQQATESVQVNGTETSDGSSNESVEEENDESQQLVEETDYGVATLRVDTAGMYKLTIADINATGLDWSEVDAEDIALTYKGQALPRAINVSSEHADTEIVFYAQLAQGRDSVYIADNAYQLSVNSQQAVTAGLEQREVETGFEYYLHTEEIEENKSYSFGIPGDDPWYETYIFAIFNPRSHIINIQVEDDADLTRTSYLDLNLVGGMDFEARDANGDGEAEPDHHAKVYINRDINSEAVYEGYLEGRNLWDIKVDIPANYLVAGENKVEIELIPDNGHFIDLVFLDSVRLDYYRPALLQEEKLSFYPAEEVDAYQFVKGNSGSKSIYASNTDGGFTHIIYSEQAVDGSDDINIVFPTADGYSQYWLIGEQDYLEPYVVYKHPVEDEDELSLDGIDYVVIADPSLLGDDLQRFADFHNDSNRATKIVSADAIFNKYGFAMKLPQAITHYLQEQSIESDYQYVLLVGGHTFNYLGYGQEEGAQALNLIPTFYRATGSNTPEGTISFTPTEVPFVDFDDDGTPDKAIGRWPVRSTEELANIIDKTLTWHQEGSVAENKSALLIGEAHDGTYDFKDSLEQLIPHMGNDANVWSNISKVYMDDINDDLAVPAGQKINHAKDLITGAFDFGSGQQQTITVFAGHGSPTRWANQNLMTPSFAKTLMNQGAPSLMLPLACYTSYYETPEIESLAHSMLLSGDNMAVGISSASVLSIPTHNTKFASLLIERLSQYHQPIGQAVLQVKQELDAMSDDYDDIILNWTTLADPTLSFNQDPIDFEDSDLPEEEEEEEER